MILAIIPAIQSWFLNEPGSIRICQHLTSWHRSSVGCKASQSWGNILPLQYFWAGHGFYTCSPDQPDEHILARITKNLQQRQQGQQHAWSHLARSQMVCRSQSRRLCTPFELRLQDPLLFGRAPGDSLLYVSHSRAHQRSAGTLGRVAYDQLLHQFSIA
jgi:hypothetical protein